MAEDEKDKKEKHGDRSRAEKAMVKPRPNLPLLRQQEQISLCEVRLRASLLLSLLELCLLPSFPSSKKKEQRHPRGEDMCHVDRQALEKDFSSQKKALLRPLFKLTSVDFPSKCRSNSGQP